MSDDDYCEMCGKDKGHDTRCMFYEAQPPKAVKRKANRSEWRRNEKRT